MNNKKKKRVIPNVSKEERLPLNEGVDNIDIEKWKKKLHNIFVEIKKDFDENYRLISCN